MTRVAVFGAGGRMGTTVCDAVEADPDLALVAAVDPKHAGAERCGVTIAAEADAVVDAGADVAVDFTVLAAAKENAHWCAARGVHAVVGTTGWSLDDLESLSNAFTT